MSADRSKSRMLLGCLVKGPLGCFAFFVGAAVVGVFFLPHTGGRHVADAIEAAFGEAFAGSLELHDAWLLSLYGPQDGRLLLRDPDGREVLRGSFGAPSLSEAMDDDGYYGPVSVHVEHCEIVTGPDGVTNLRRAFTPKVQGGDVRVDVNTSGAKQVDLRLSIDRLLWHDAAGGTTFELASFLGDATVRFEGGRAAVELKGKGIVAGEPSGQLETRVFVPDLEAFARDRGGTGQLEVRLQELDSRQLGLVTGQGEVFVESFGPRTERFALVADRLQDRTVQLTVDVASPQAEMTLTGHLDRETHRLVALEGDHLQASFAQGSGWADRLVSGLLPVIDEVRSADPGDVIAIESKRFALPLHHDVAALDGVFALELAPASYRIDERLHERLPGGLSALQTSGSVLHLVLGVQDGVVRYESVAIPLDSGALGVDGAYDLRSGDANLVLRLPPELTGDDESVFQIVGPWGLADIAPAPR